MQVRAPKGEIFDNPVHDMDFLNWVASQAQDITRFAEVVTKLKEGQKVVSLALINECLAKYTWFFTVQTSFLQIYKNKHRILKEEADIIFDSIYRDVKEWVTDYKTGIGKKYTKKDATQAEIKREAFSHDDWSKYKGLLDQISELDLKISAQRRYLKIIEKLDIILQVLKKRDEKEIKYLYLET